MLLLSRLIAMAWGGPRLAGLAVRKAGGVPPLAWNTSPTQLLGRTEVPGSQTLFATNTAAASTSRPRPRRRRRGDASLKKLASAARMTAGARKKPG